MAFDQVTCCNNILPDHFLGCSHIAVSHAPISQISARVIVIQGVGADDVKEVREIVQHLFTNIVKPARTTSSKRDSQQAKKHVDNLRFQLVDDMLWMWNTDSFLDRAKELVKKAINKHAKYTTTELDRSRPVKKGAAIEVDSVNR